MQKSVLYFTELRYSLHQVNQLTMHYGNVIRVIDRRMRPDLGNGNDYFEITYYYVG